MRKKMKCLVAIGLSLCLAIPWMPALALDKSSVQGAQSAVSDYDRQKAGTVISFDNLETFVQGTDYTLGGALPANAVSLTSEVDHAGAMEGGKSLKMAGRTYSYNRLKLKNAFSNVPFAEADIGKTFHVSAYVRSTGAGKIGLGVYGDTGSAYATSPIIHHSVEVEPDVWERISFDYTITPKAVEEAADMLCIDQPNGTQMLDTIYVDDIIVREGGEATYFDNLDSFSYNVDFTDGGAYPNPQQNIKLTSDQNHTGASAGKSLMLTGRTLAQHRAKLLNIIKHNTTENIGKAYIISAYVKADTACKIMMATYSPQNTDYAFTPYTQATVDVNANEWTKISIDYTVCEHSIAQGISQLGIGQPNGVAATGTIYVDDIVVAEQPMLQFSTIQADPDAMFDALPDGNVLVNANAVLSANQNSSTAHYVKSTVNVEGMPFTQAANFDMLDKPEIPYSYQIAMPITTGAFANGDMMLIAVYFRVLSSQAEDNQGHVQFIVEENQGDYRKHLQADAKAPADGVWRKFYLPSGVISRYENSSVSAKIRLGYEVQEVEIGGYELLHYPSTLGLVPDDLPNTVTSYDGMDINQEWRLEAQDRIEVLRKDDVNILVEDQDGNPLSGAKVDLDMTEHDFMWGTAVNGNLLGSNSNQKKYQQAVRTYFNGAVLESEHKWVPYEQNPTQARNLVNWLEENGIENIRGHALMWDREYYEDNTSIPADVPGLYNNKTALDARIKGHIDSICGAFQGELVDWDVVNELVGNHTITELYNKTPLIQWFDWARAADPDATLYINETGITGNGDTGLNTFTGYLDWMVENDVDFDGIGVQSHFSSACHPMEFYRQIETLAAYGKKMKITEYDFKNSGALHGNFTRDIMTLCFSHPNMEGFYMWGFWDGSHWLDSATLFDQNWNLKPSGHEYVDLVFNRWWTDECGKTDANGLFTTRAYYGDHTITVDYMGIKTTEQVSVIKGQDNTFTVIFDLDDFAFTDAKTIGKYIDFDDRSTFVNNVDFVAGGAYGPENIVLSSEEDHTTGTGKSLKMGGRTLAQHRIKIRKAFSADETFGGRDLGKTFRISCWVKPDTTGKILFGLYGDTGTTYATSPISGGSINQDVTAGEWSKLEFDYTVTQETVDGEISMVGIGQSGGTIIPTIYVDDFSVVEINTDETFDNKTVITPNVDFAVLGGYSAGNVALCDDNHKEGTGKSLKLSNRTQAGEGVKLFGSLSDWMFSEYMIGKTLHISTWVKADQATDILLGVYGGADTAYETVPLASTVVEVAANEWTQVLMDYVVTQDTLDNGIPVIGISQPGSATGVASTIFVDDLYVTSVKYDDELSLDSDALTDMPVLEEYDSFIVPEAPIEEESSFELEFLPMDELGDMLE